MTLQGTTVVSVKHNFETAHRLPFLGGKCQNLHGHSWNVEVGLLNTHFPGGVNEQGISVEYALVKRVIRGWIDGHLDHGTMLGDSDPLIDVASTLGKVFVFGSGKGDIELFKTENQGIVGTYKDLPWPTVEAVAQMLGVKLQEAVEQACGSHVWVDTVHLEETAVNSATFMPGFLRTVTEEKVDVTPQ